MCTNYVCMCDGTYNVYSSTFSVVIYEITTLVSIPVGLSLCIRED